MFRVVFLSLLMAFFSYNSFAQYSEHIVILWDVTGSLLPQKKGEKDYNGDPLPAYSKGNGMWKELKKAVIDCIEFVEEDPSNKITVVTFHDHVRDVFSRNASLNGKKDLVNFVTNYKYRGHKYTNIVEPIKRFYNLLDDKKVNYMFLFTDGDNDAPTRPQFIPTLDSWNRFTEGFNAYGFYVLVHPNADKPNIRTSVESQDNFWIVPDAKVRIKICSLPTTIKYNLRDDKGPKKINMGGKYAGAKGDVQLTTQDQFYDIVSNLTPLTQGEIQIEIKPKDGIVPPQNHTVILNPITKNTDQYTFVGPSAIKLEVSNIPERSLDLAIEDNEFGETVLYAPFFGLTKEGEQAGTRINVDFSDQARVEGSSAVMKVYFIDEDDEKALSATSLNLKLLINGEERDSYRLTPDTKEVHLSVVGDAKTEEDTYYGRIELIPTNLDNYHINGTPEIFKWRFDFIHKWHPLKVVLIWLMILLVSAFLIWMLLLKRMFYPTFGGLQKTFLIPGSAPLVVKFRGARKVVISAENIKPQTAWNRFWTGKIIYKKHEAFEKSMILLPSSRRRILVKSETGAYHISPNPMPGIGHATITNMQTNLKIDIN